MCIPTIVHRQKVMELSTCQVQGTDLLLNLNGVWLEYGTQVYDDHIKNSLEEEQQNKRGYQLVHL